MTFLPTIEVEEVSKTFWIPHEQRARLKEYFAHPFKRGRVRAQRRPPGGDLLGAAGEFFGVIGRTAAARARS